MTVFYHNISKEIMNETDLDDFLDNYEQGNIIYKSESGNALIEKVIDDELTIMIEAKNIADAEMNDD